MLGRRARGRGRGGGGLEVGLEVGEEVGQEVAAVAEAGALGGGGALALAQAGAFEGQIQRGAGDGILICVSARRVYLNAVRWRQGLTCIE